MSNYVVRAALLAAALLASHGRADEAAPPRLPAPGVGVFFNTADVEAMRRKILVAPCQAIYDECRKKADIGLADWPTNRLAIEPVADKLIDLQAEAVPAKFLPPDGAKAAKLLSAHALDGAPCAAFVYLMTGEKKYADYAWNVFEMCSRVNRWGWFPWDGVQMPQIFYGGYSRNMVLVADAVWDTLTPAQRQHSREVIAEKAVEPYYRLVLQTPGMGLHHLRSKNQGDNALAAALVDSLFVGDAVADNRIWFNSLLQTFHWAVTHDIGWMGQHLEQDQPGYWSVSMQNLYTAAAALQHVKGIDLRGHPGFEQATYYPVIHEASVRPFNIQGDKSTAIDTNYRGPCGTLSTRPLGLPAGPRCGPWWLDYAVHFPESPALYFLRKEMVPAGAPTKLPRDQSAHQWALGDLLAIAWWDDRLATGEARPPAALALFTDRMAGMRSGYGFGETYLYFDGDLFLSARKEMLGNTSGMAWHFPWYQYQIMESGIETEGELFAPSPLIAEAADEGPFAFFHATVGSSTAEYYVQEGQRQSCRHFDRHDRSVLYVRPAPGASDYFLFADDVQFKDPAPRWHAWTWHVWNDRMFTNSWGRFTPQGANAVRVERPNADLWIQFLDPASMAFEQHGVPSQHRWNFDMDDNAQMLRAMAGGYDPAPAGAKPVVLAPAVWQGMGNVQDNAALIEKAAPAQACATVAGIVPGTRYRASVQVRKEQCKAYEMVGWTLDLQLLDASGAVAAKPWTPAGHPHPLRLVDPLSNTPTHDWAEAATYFDAPSNAVAVRAMLAKPNGKLWLRELRLEPLGVPKRELCQKFLTLVMPLAKGAPPPQIAGDAKGGITVTHADGSRDRLSVADDGTVHAQTTRGGRTVAFDSRKQAASGSGRLLTNSEKSAAVLRAGLKPVLDDLAAQRDVRTAKGERNLALTAKVTASAVRDDRFAAAHVIDNQTAEYPLDGHLDYTLGEVATSPCVGYGRGRDSLASRGDAFPLYVRPTYWLLPEGQLGYVELELAQPADVTLVRLLNTSNAGLNDFAAHAFKVEVLDSERRVLDNREDRFGKVFDRPFKQAFFEPKWFSQYARTFEGLLDPGETVPFGDGWKDVPMAHARNVKYVRVTITKFWGIGGGLNEIQVYGK